MNSELNQHRGTETILVVDDEVLIRTMLSDVLEDFGYAVIVAVDGKDAVEKYIQNGDKIDLVITDIIMPRKDGITTYMDIKSINQSAKILLMSGFIPESMKTEQNIPIIKKPFKSLDVVQQIRNALDSTL